MKVSTLLASASLAAAANTTSNDACSKVNKAHQQAIQKNTTAVVPAALAQECLKSMPFPKDVAHEFLAELRKYIGFQSTLEILQDPPSTYLSQPVDILKGLDAIEKKSYDSHYDFDYDIGQLINSANDGHFSVSLCSLAIFSFQRPQGQMVSVSKDGRETPSLYLYSDAKQLAAENSTVSPVSTINGQDAAQYLQKEVASSRRSQDPDARYNQLFTSIAILSSGAPREAGGAVTNNYDVYPGEDKLEVQFKNGTSFTVETVAQISKLFNATSGEELFHSFCGPVTPSKTNGTEPAAPTKPPSPSGPTGYPDPHLRDDYNQLNGYYFDNDSAAIFIPSFDSDGLPDNSSQLFANTTIQFLRQAVADGRTKLVIDVSGNGGGTITRAFDLFKIFFPSEFPYSATRFRRTGASKKLAAALGTVKSDDYQDVNAFGYQAAVTPDQYADFSSVEEFLGNQTQHGVAVSSLFANFNYTATSNEDLPIHGYGPWRGVDGSLFKPENIIIVGDGACASTCTTFVNLMTNVGKVRTVAFGGRPEEKPMQIMGGVRGAQASQYSELGLFVNKAAQAVQNLTNTSAAFSSDFKKEFIKTTPIPLAKFPVRLAGGSVNLRNAYQQGNDDLPLQFQYQAADCRLFYTEENVRNPASIWKSAKDALWGGKGCVRGSTGAKGSQEDNATSTHGGSSGNGANGKPPGTSGAMPVSIAWSSIAGGLLLMLWTTL
ncbi:hypothetical protein LMH87_010870 [Akanthomyces muscarius]|uniref:Tail specific protease domain-containing protein n=2 Tax=Akanthomyces muscarius TaxID=2231603 RepID=A0A9W8Q829_AKAMU|nr:hypothetical protein LMH87_010870 [Akanthomyces muscarius]KAJ4150104.1 hypothetical protein LMH87_010870 [Akanthomyces muscarius]